MTEGSNPGSPSPEGHRTVISRTIRAFFVTAPIILGAVFVRGVVLYEGASLSLVPVVAAVGGLFLGCLAYAVLTSWGSGGWMEVAAWVIAGAVGLDAMVAVVFFAMPIDAGDQALVRSVAFWGFWTVAGGITGFAYWMIAQASR